MIKFNSSEPVSLNVQTLEIIISEIKNDPMAGWFGLPKLIDQNLLNQIKTVANKIRSHSKYLVCIGIGGSYLGHKAVIDALNPESSTEILYAGNNLSSFELQKLLQKIGNEDFSINVISKSGTTLEPAIAYRILKEKLFQKYTDHAKEHIFITTDAKSGALRSEILQEGYTNFTIPDNIGGRYSVLTPVGLLPMAVAGIDLDKLIAGAVVESEELEIRHLGDLAAAKYASARYNLFKQNYPVEVLGTFEPSMSTFFEWWKQLFGESEGKNQQGIFPASAIYTTDLHSLGQYLQEGRRDIFETILSFEQAPGSDFIISHDAQNLDQLNYLAGKSLKFINDQAREATIIAHRAGGIPVFELSVPDYSPEAFGALIYFFEFSCAISAKLCGVDPFDQPGVQAYKDSMFTLLGKPGF